MYKSKKYITILSRYPFFSVFFFCRFYHNCCIVSIIMLLNKTYLVYFFFFCFSFCYDSSHFVTMGEDRYRGHNEEVNTEKWRCGIWSPVGMEDHPFALKPTPYGKPPKIWRTLIIRLMGAISGLTFIIYAQTRHTRSY